MLVGVTKYLAQRSVGLKQPSAMDVKAACVASRAGAGRLRRTVARGLSRRAWKNVQDVTSHPPLAPALTRSLYPVTLWGYHPAPGTVWFNAPPPRRKQESL